MPRKRSSKTSVMGIENVQCFVLKSTSYSMLLGWDSSFTETQGCLGVTQGDVTYLKYLLWIRTLILMHKSSDTLLENEQKTVPLRNMRSQLHTLPKKKLPLCFMCLTTRTRIQIHTDFKRN